MGRTALLPTPASGASKPEETAGAIRSWSTTPSDQKNVHLEHGRLVITARREDYTGRDGISRHFTSARIKTQGKFAQAYGRFEARIRLPTGQGLWPAFWMLGDNIEQTGWPACGEIDIMENIGNELSTVHGTMDKHLYETRTPADLTAGTSWVYNHPFFLILNVAVGGSWPGNPDSTTTFPQAMLVDYVRVYRRSAHDPAQLLVNRLHADVNCAKQSRHLRPVHLAVFGRGWSTSPATRGQALLLEGCVTCPRLRPRAPAGGVRALMAANARMRPHFAIRAGRVFCNRRVYVHPEPA